jgi:hypothetical protein
MEDFFRSILISGELKQIVERLPSRGGVRRAINLLPSNLLIINELDTGASCGNIAERKTA